jgi:hypothetical protein
MNKTVTPTLAPTEPGVRCGFTGCGDLPVQDLFLIIAFLVLVCIGSGVCCVRCLVNRDEQKQVRRLRNRRTLEGTIATSNNPTAMSSTNAQTQAAGTTASVADKSNSAQDVSPENPAEGARRKSSTRSRRSWFGRKSSSSTNSKRNSGVAGSSNAADLEMDDGPLAQMEQARLAAEAEARTSGQFAEENYNDDRLSRSESGARRSNTGMRLSRTRGASMSGGWGAAAGGRASDQPMDKGEAADMEMARRMQLEEAVLAREEGLLGNNNNNNNNNNSSGQDSRYQDERADNDNYSDGYSDGSQYSEYSDDGEESDEGEPTRVQFVPRSL